MSIVDSNALVQVNSGPDMLAADLVTAIGLEDEFVVQAEARAGPGPVVDRKSGVAVGLRDSTVCGGSIGSNTR